MHRASIEPVVKNDRNFHLRAGTRRMTATLCCKTAKLQNCKTSKLQICHSFPRSSFLFPFFSLWQLCTLERRMEPRYEATSLNIFSSISCSILASSTTSSYRWSYKETAGVAIIRDKDVCYLLLNVQKMMWMKAIAKKCVQTKLWMKSWAVFCSSNFWIIYTVNLGLSWGFGAAITFHKHTNKASSAWIIVTQTDQGIIAVFFVFCLNKLWWGTTEVQTRPISQLWRKGHNLLLGAAWSTTQPANPRKAKSSSAKLAPSPV